MSSACRRNTPSSTGRAYTPPAAPPAAYLAMLDGTGMTHGVLIQVSVHGTDNRLMLETLRANRQRLRGIAVAPLGLPDKDYRDMQNAGVVGLRLNVLYGGGIGFDSSLTTARCAGNSAGTCSSCSTRASSPALAPDLGELPVPFVVDHMGHFPASPRREGAGLPDPPRPRTRRRLGEAIGCLPCDQRRAALRDTIPLARALYDVAPDRCVWGSDWPHVANWKHMPNVGELLDLLADWVPDEAQRLLRAGRQPGAALRVLARRSSAHASRDGVRLGLCDHAARGPTVIAAAHWISHLRLDWDSPSPSRLGVECCRGGVRSFATTPAAPGLSDRDPVRAFSLQRQIEDLEAVARGRKDAPDSPCWACGPAAPPRSTMPFATPSE